MDVDAPLQKFFYASLSGHNWAEEWLAAWVEPDNFSHLSCSHGSKFRRNRI